MTTTFKNTKTAAITITMFVILSIVGTTIYFSQKGKDFQSSIDLERLKTESLLSEKLKLEKEIAGIQADMETLNNNNGILKSENMKQAESLKKKSSGVVNTGSKQIKTLKKEIEALNKLKSGLSIELADAKKRLKEMEADNGDLKKQIAMLNANNKQLSDDLAMMKGISADQFALSAYKGKNEKLTVKAKKVNKLSTRFKVPSYVASNAGFKIKTPDGQIIDKTAKGMSMTITDDIPEEYASVDGIQPTEVMKEIELNYTPDKKLKSGAYKIELYNGGNYLTSCIINLK